MKRNKNLLLILFISILISPILFAGKTYKSNINKEMQNRRVKGYVTDQHNLAIVGAAVQLLGTTNGTLTNLAGYYQIAVPVTGVSTLQYTDPGCESQQRIVSPADSVINVQMVCE